MTGHDDVVPPSAGGALTDDAFARIEALFEPIDADLGSTIRETE